ncbi:hypothetical protein SDRG_14459, partial [Saprolegnia diclina VS20]
AAWRFRPIAYFIEEDSIDIADDDDDHPVCLVFWPKALRLTLLGLVRTVALLRDHVDGSCSDDFGFGSTHALFEAGVRFFIGAQRGQRLRPRAELGPAQFDRSSRLAMANVLFDYGDRALMADYLSGMRWNAHDVVVVPWVVSVVRRFGLLAMTEAFSSLHIKTSGTFRSKVLEGIKADNPSCERALYEMASRWWTDHYSLGGKGGGNIQLAAWLYENAMAPSTHVNLSTRLPA